MTTINMAFSFDHNYYRQAAVAISSVLHCAREGVSFAFYCMCADDVTVYDLNELSFIVKQKSKDSTVKFIRAGNVFDGAYEWRGLTKAMYFRLLLHRYLPDVDKIVYSDVDTLFAGDLSELWAIPLGDRLFGAVKSSINLDSVFKEHLARHDYFKQHLSDAQGRIFNSGFMVMNLGAIRRSGIEEQWLSMSRHQQFRYGDQDILNITCKARVLFLPPKYNFLTNVAERYTGLAAENVISAEQLDALLKGPVMYHYAGMKPWDNKRIAAAGRWWTFVARQTPYQEHFQLRLDLLEKQKQLNLATQTIQRLKSGLSGLV